MSLLPMSLRIFTPTVGVVEILYKAILTVHLFPTLCSMMSCWKLEISHGGDIHTTDVGKMLQIMAFPPGDPVVEHFPK